MSIEVNEAKCTGCGCCILVCPEEALDNLPSFIAGIDEAIYLARAEVEAPDVEDKDFPVPVRYRIVGK